MKKVKCLVCGYIHDESKDGPFENLPDGWVCPICKAEKSAFAPEQDAPTYTSNRDLLHDEKELTSLELSAICSNLARGCEKQYLKTESELFTKLADELKSKSEPDYDARINMLVDLVERDLSENFPLVQDIASENADRGALRAYTWSYKVTVMLKTLLERYQKVGQAMIDNTGVYVCTICGYIYVGDELPTLCPVCKVPNYKFEEIGG
ncbi:MAG: rubredoxin [Clostridia bacterium]